MAIIRVIKSIIYKHINKPFPFCLVSLYILPFWVLYSKYTCTLCVDAYISIKTRNEKSVPNAKKDIQSRVKSVCPEHWGLEARLRELSLSKGEKGLHLRP